MSDDRPAGIRFNHVMCTAVLGMPGGEGADSLFHPVTTTAPSWGLRQSVNSVQTNQPIRSIWFPSRLFHVRHVVVAQRSSVRYLQTLPRRSTGVDGTAKFVELELQYVYNRRPTSLHI